MELVIVAFPEESAETTRTFCDLAELVADNKKGLDEGTVAVVTPWFKDIKEAGDYVKWDSKCREYLMILDSSPRHEAPVYTEAAYTGHTINHVAVLLHHPPRPAPPRLPHARDSGVTRPNP